MVFENRVILFKYIKMHKVAMQVRKIPLAADDRLFKTDSCVSLNTAFLDAYYRKSYHSEW